MFQFWLLQIRTSGTQASTADIIEFSKLFEDQLTLDNLSKEQLRALSKLLLLPPYGSSTILRFQLRMKLRQLEVDDQVSTIDDRWSCVIVLSCSWSCEMGLIPWQLQSYKVLLKLEGWGPSECQRKGCVHSYNRLAQQKYCYDMNVLLGIMWNTI